MHRAWHKLKAANAAYERSLQIERWKRQRMPEQNQDGEEQENDKQPMGTGSRVALATFLVALLLPYPFQPGGEFVILPA